MSAPRSPAIAVSRDLGRIARDLDRAIEKVAGQRVAFTLLIFTAGRANYISTAARPDSVREIRRLLEMWDAGMPDVPAHKII